MDEIFWRIKSSKMSFHENYGLCASRHSTETPANRDCILSNFSKHCCGKAATGEAVMSRHSQGGGGGGVEVQRPRFYLLVLLLNDV